MGLSYWICAAEWNYDEHEIKIKIANMLIIDKRKFHPECVVCCALTVKESSEFVITRH